MNKQKIIIDKCTLQGYSLQRLIQLAQKHFLILPHILFEECLTTESADPENLLERAEKLIKKGAYITCSRRRMIEMEKSTLQPLNSIIDEEGTTAIRNNNIPITKKNIQREAEESKKAFKPILDEVEKLAHAFWDNLPNYPPLSKSWKKSDKDSALCEICIAVEDDLKQWIPIFSPKNHSYITKEWTSWYIYKVLLTYGLFWTYMRNTSGPSYGTNIENDVFDIIYLFPVSKADVFITRDKKLLFPLAQAMFPKKAVSYDIPDDLTGGGDNVKE